MCIVYVAWHMVDVHAVLWSLSMWCGIYDIKHMHMNEYLLRPKLSQKGSSWLIHFLLVHSKLNKRHGRTIYHAPCSLIQVTAGLSGAYLCGETHGEGEGWFSRNHGSQAQMWTLPMAVASPQCGSGHTSR